MQELRVAVKTNAMVIHNIAHHDSPSENKFQMKVVRIVSSSMERQIDESTQIENSDV